MRLPQSDIEALVQPFDPRQLFKVTAISFSEMPRRKTPCMFERKIVKKAKRLVWRMSATNPAGEFVCDGKRQVKRRDAAEVHERGCRASSTDLSNGSDMTETEMNTLPGELVDEFLKVGR